MSKNKSKKSREEILELSIAYIAEEGFDLSIKELCKATKIKKSQFRSEFKSIGKLEKYVWSDLMRSAINTVNNDPQFNKFSKGEKLLSLYYIFFENCGLNSGFLAKSVSHHGRVGMLKVLKPLKKEFTAFNKSIHHLELPFGNVYGDSINRLSQLGVGEVFYGQFLFLLDFWVNDKSSDFEKTDIAIEKTVRASMDLLDVTPIKSALDLAKFIWQERLS